MCREIPPPWEMSNKGRAIGGVSRNYVCAILTLKQDILALEFFWNFISNLILIDFFHGASNYTISRYQNHSVTLVVEQTIYIEHFPPA